MRAPFAALLLCALPSGATAAPIQTLVLEGDAVPGAPGETFESFREVQIGQTGRVAFAATDTARRGAYAVDDSGALVTLARIGDAVPDLPGETSGFVYGPFALASGRVAFGSDLSAGTAILVWDPVTGTAVAARAGDEVEGTGGANVFQLTHGGGFTPSGPVFSGVLVGGDATADSDEVALRPGAGGPSVLLREGEPAPGVPGLAVMFPGVVAPDDRSERLLASSLFTAYRIDETGSFELLYDFSPTTSEFAEFNSGPAFSWERLGFGARLSSEPASSDEGVWIIDGDSPLTRAVSEGDGVDSGRFAFEADTTGPGAEARSSILLHDPSGGLALVARSGEAVPGLLDHVFAGALGAPRMNAGGDLVFWAAIEPSGGAPAQAIFVLRAGGALELLVREGQTLEIAPGDVRTVSQLTPPPLCIPPCDARILSDDGRLVFRADFMDETSGVFLAVLPEPSVAALVLGAAAMLGVRVARQQRHAGRDR
jgi:hypothetical protein